MRVVAFDIDGTLNAYPATLGDMMRALRYCGAKVIVISGHDSKVTPEVWNEKAQHLCDLGLSDAYDVLVAVDGPEKMVAGRKAVYLRSMGCDLLVDNSERNARACAKAGIVVLVPWPTRSEF